MSGQVAHGAAVRLRTTLRWLTVVLLLTGSAGAQGLELRVFDVGQGDAVLIRAASAPRGITRATRPTFGRKAVSSSMR